MSSVAFFPHYYIETTLYIFLYLITTIYILAIKSPKFGGVSLVEVGQRLGGIQFPADFGPGYQFDVL